ncbi:MAG: EAL domain-containing protein [Pseudomonadota bacterium]
MARKRILIVDDDQSVRLIVSAALQSDDHELADACDGREALAILPGFRPHLVLLDVMMPRLDGYRTCAVLRTTALAADIPVLMMTGLGDEIAIEKACKCGATDFISKPFNRVILRKRVRYLLRAGEILQQWRASERRLRDAHQLARLGDWQWDPVTQTLTISDEARAALGVPSDCDSLAGLLDCLRASDRPRVRSLLDGPGSCRPLSIEHDILLKGGEERSLHHEIVCFDDDATQRRVLTGTVQDVSELRLNQQRVLRLAFFDELTGLPNRAGLYQQLELVLEVAHAIGGSGTVFCVDLDGFKRVNDTLGHDAGDQLLRETKDRLIGCLEQYRQPPMSHESASVARLSGDEFVLVAPQLREPAAVDALAGKVLSAIQRPFILGTQDVFLSASIGIASFRLSAGDGRQAGEAEALLRDADAAMYEARERGGSRFVHYSEAWKERARARLDLESRLRRALERNEFELFYQPKVDCSSRAVLGVEALLRWRCPEVGLIPPMDFVPLAEECGLIVPIGEWVLHQACLQACTWLGRGWDFAMAVNLAARQFRDRDLVALIRQTLTGTGMPPTLLELELTEGTLMDDVKHASSVLAELRQMGVRIAIDDFGTGYSSLSYLRSLPVDTLKIDRSFVRDVTENQDSAAICAAIIGVSKSLRLNVVAEGVETEAQFAFLAAHRCEEIQGYLISRPLAADAFEAWYAGRPGLLRSELESSGTVSLG